MLPITLLNQLDLHLLFRPNEDVLHLLLDSKAVIYCYLSATRSSKWTQRRRIVQLGIGFCRWVLRIHF